MKSYYEKLVEEKGIEAAKAYMRDLSSKVKKRGLANASKETILKVQKAALDKRHEKIKLQEEKEKREKPQSDS